MVMKVTLTHIGVVALGRMLAIWSFVLGLLFLLIGSIVIAITTLLGVLTSNSPVEMFGGGLIGFVVFLVSGVFGLLLNAVFAFILGCLMAIVYNVILGVGGGIDVDFAERQR